MPRPRTAKSTIKNDPFGTVIPLPIEQDEPAAPAALGPEEPVTQIKQTSDEERVPRSEPPKPSQPVRVTNADKPRRLEPALEPIKPGKQKLTVHVDRELAERVKNAAYWNPRLTIAGIAEQGIRQAIEKIEREYGGRYEVREGQLIGGRPIK